MSFLNKPKNNYFSCEHWIELQETHRKWLTSKPKQHQFFAQAVRCIPTNESRPFYELFSLASMHVVALYQKLARQCQKEDPSMLQLLFAQLCQSMHTCALDKLCKWIYEKPRLWRQQKTKRYCQKLDDWRQNNHHMNRQDNRQDQFDEMASQTIEQIFAQCNIQPQHAAASYIGFLCGFNQMQHVLVAMLNKKMADNSIQSVAQQTLRLQAGFCVEKILHTWPQHELPTIAALSNAMCQNKASKK